MLPHKKKSPAGLAPTAGEGRYADQIIMRIKQKQQGLNFRPECPLCSQGPLVGQEHFRLFRAIHQRVPFLRDPAVVWNFPERDDLHGPSALEVRCDGQVYLHYSTPSRWRKRLWKPLTWASNSPRFISAVTWVLPI